MKRIRKIQVKLILIIMGLPWVLSASAFAATADVSQIESFMQSVIQALAGLAGLVATAFFVVGGYRYITSSGNPEHLERPSELSCSQQQD